MDPRKVAQICGLVGGLAFVVKYFLSGAADTGLTVLGIVLITVALFELGLLTVKKAALALRYFVAVALLCLVWGVVVLIRGGISDGDVVDALFGAVVALISVAQLVRPGETTRETL